MLFAQPEIALQTAASLSAREPKRVERSPISTTLAEDRSGGTKTLGTL
jgi:hypothetical protein